MLRLCGHRVIRFLNTFNMASDTASVLQVEISSMQESMQKQLDNMRQRQSIQDSGSLREVEEMLVKLQQEHEEAMTVTLTELERLQKKLNETENEREKVREVMGR